MIDQLQGLQKEFDKAIKNIASFDALEILEQEYFARKSGTLSLAMKELKDLGGEAKKSAGMVANEVKQAIEASIAIKKDELRRAEMAGLGDRERIDVTQAFPQQRGHLHPITLAQQDMEAVAERMGFIIEDGPELDSDYYVFGGLNFPDDHPARESMDTFYIKDHPNWCMRAHVSNMQVRLMKKYNDGGKKAVRAAYPGLVFRNEAIDASHEHSFHQFESIVVDKDISIAHLVGIIKELLSGLFKKQINVRLRPGYFPFVEPGFEMDMQCLLCDGDGCSVCKQTGWVEMLGCGLVHPNVIREGGYDPAQWQGLAFGMGLTRLAMMRYGIEDIRHFMGGDLRFLQQF